MKKDKRCKIRIAFFFLFLIAPFLFSGCDETGGVFSPEPPLKITARNSMVHGYVVQASNLDTRPLAIAAMALSSDRQSESDIYRCVLKSGETVEIGFLELGGWAIEDGEKVVIETDGYAMMQCICTGNTYNVSRYSDND